MAVRLTETAIRAAMREAEATGRRDLVDAGMAGLRLRVSPPSSRAPLPAARWALTIRDRDGRMRRFPIGDYPALGIADARREAEALKQKVKHDGADPVAERRRARAVTRDAKDGRGTLAALLDIYGGPIKPDAEARKVRVIGPGKDLKTWKAQRQCVEAVFKRFVRKPLAALNAADLQMAADGWRSATNAAAAVRYLRPVLKWAAQRQYLPRDVAFIVPPVPVRRRQRVLAVDELGAILPALRDAANPYRQAMRWMLLTLCRRDEAASATWADVDLDAALWRIPETKNGQAHTVPLSRQAVAMLAGMERVKGVPLIFVSASGGRLVNWDRETKKVHETTQTTGWQRHDLRRTGATMLGELGVEPHVIEAALNHISIHSQLAATYNRARYLPAVTAALQMLADRLDGITDGGAEVVSLDTARERIA
jgi:integrase